MKILLALAVLSLAAPLAAQTSNSGIVERVAKQPSQADTETLEDTAENAPKLVISRDPKDMNDTRGMDVATVITWVDRNGVRWYTDNPKLAPAQAKTRQVYSMPAATPTTPALAPLVIRGYDDQNHEEHQD